MDHEYAADRHLGTLRPDPELWQALREGDGLREILEDFYGRVYADPRLVHFFEGTTIERAIEKQWSFLCQVFTGKKVYFGDRPRNAHHWMVISHELFDYREELMEACLRRYGLAEPLIRRWRGMEEIYRKQIVKDEPRPKRLRGHVLPVEGYEELTLDVGALCDGCTAVLEPGTNTRYHVRTGKTFCEPCARERLAQSGKVQGAA